MAKFETVLTVRIPMEGSNKREAREKAQKQVRGHLRGKWPKAEVKAMSADKILAAGELYDKNAFERELAIAVSDDDKLYDQYVEEMNSTHNTIVGRQDYQKEEAKVRKKYYRVLLENMQPMSLVMEVAAASPDMNKSFSRFPAQQVANDILTRGHTPTDKQLNALINTYLNYLVQEHIEPRGL